MSNQQQIAPDGQAIATAANPIARPPTITKSPPAERKFPCKNCGAKVEFDPTQRVLKCPYCGHVEEIAPSAEGVAELDYQQYLQKQLNELIAIPGRSTEVRCPGCGATVLLEDNVATDQCPFCATHLENATPRQAQNQIQPHAILPFAVSHKQAVETFNRWIASLWFAPSNLAKLANLGRLSGVYMPFWTYDSMTYSHYTGERGDDYWDTETYTETDAQGNVQTRTRQVQKTRWYSVSGEVDHFFDDVLIYASQSLPSPSVDRLQPWDFPQIESFQPSFLAGFKTERYTISLADGFTQARQVMDRDIRTLCSRDIGGDHQRVRSVNTQHVGVTFKHILLPIWLAVYRYNGQTFRILVNARTGEVAGARPYSFFKIAALVLAIILAVAILILIVLAAQSHR